MLLNKNVFNVRVKRKTREFTIENNGVPERFLRKMMENVS